MGYLQNQELLLRAYRLGLMHSSVPFLSLHRSRAIPTEYQLVPVVMALNRLPVRLLLADDVGLGKTIEAGLIVTELIARGLARRLLVICPASLREQWKEALTYFFHIDAYIFSNRHRRELERHLPSGANPLEFYNAFIVSIDYAKMTAIKNLLLEVPWDIVIIDEAHQVAKPHQTSSKHTITMERWELAQAIAFSPKVKHLLLLTATPHNGYTDSFASLLYLLNPNTVSNFPENPRIYRNIAKHHICQRRRQDIELWFRTGVHFPKRDQKEEIIKSNPIELKVIRAVRDYGNFIMIQAKFASVQKQTLAGWTVLHLHKRALSSPYALLCSLRNRKNRLKQCLKALWDEDTGISEQVARANVLDEETGDQLTYEEAWQRIESVVLTNITFWEKELQVLDSLISLAKKITPSKDSKLQHLLKQVLPFYFRKHPRLIIFTKYKDTMEYVAKQIENSPDYKGEVKVIKISGDLNERQRLEKFAEFEQAERAIIVATDAISEGINLQQACCQLIHYELPWNPNRLEQRNVWIL